MPWELAVIACGCVVVVGLTFVAAKALVLYWLATEGRELVRREVARLIGETKNDGT